MTEFKRYLSPQLIGALNKLADPRTPPNWWQDVLKSKHLHLAVRGGYLNAYAQGQSVFKIGPGLDSGGDPEVSIHYKYLLEPDCPRGEEYIHFTGKCFDVDPLTVICTNYEPGRTLPRLIAAASPYTSEEKKGVHVIARQNETVIDLEIAFTPTGGAEEHARALRIDLAALHPDGDKKAKLVFYEAKRADDSRLHTGAKGDAEVVEQMESYDRFLRTSASDLARAYKDVCWTLVRLRSHSSRSPAQIIRDVGAESPTRTLSVDPVARLLVFGFDQDTKYGENFMGRIKTLQGRLARPVVAKGNPVAFNLLKDYVRFPPSAPVA